MSVALSWSLLFAAGLVEIVMALALKYAEGFSRLWPTTLAVVAALVSIALLSAALKSLPVGVAYAVWTGIGSLGVAAVGIVVLGESAALPKLVCIATIVAGIAGLKWLDT